MPSEKNFTLVWRQFVHSRVNDINAVDRFALPRLDSRIKLLHRKYVMTIISTVINVLENSLEAKIRRRSIA